jgi:hypothetical protein
MYGSYPKQEKLMEGKQSFSCCSSVFVMILGGNVNVFLFCSNKRSWIPRLIHAGSRKEALVRQGRGIIKMTWVGGHPLASILERVMEPPLVSPDPSVLPSDRASGCWGHRIMTRMRKLPPAHRFSERLIGVRSCFLHCIEVILSSWPDRFESNFRAPSIT